MGRLTEAKLQIWCRNGAAVSGKSDGDGLTFSISKAQAGTETGTWELRYRFGRRARWLTIGKYPDLTLKEARKRAAKERVKVGDGIDVVAEKRRTRLALKAAKTFGELAEDYMTRAGPDLAMSTRYDRRRFLDKDILPSIGDLRLEDISGAEIVHMVDEIGKRSTTMARRAFAITSVIFSHGIAKHLAKTNPCASLRLKAILGKKQPIRETVSLTEQQLRALLPSVDSMGRANGLAARIVLATAVRKQELRLARWEHLDLDGGLWTIPAENSKNGKPFVIPLPAIVVGWFLELQERARGCPWVLPGQNHRDPVSDSTINAALLRLPQGTPPFTVHDLRRTARTLLGKLKVNVIVAEKCLNHTLGGLVDVYDQGDYLAERREALELLTKFLVACEEGRPWNVTPLQAVA